MLCIVNIIHMYVYVYMCLYIQTHIDTDIMTFSGLVFDWTISAAPFPKKGKKLPCRKDRSGINMFPQRWFLVIHLCGILKRSM